MIRPETIKTKAIRKYLSFLQSKMEGTPFNKLVIRGDKSYSKSSPTEFEREILSIIFHSKEKKGFGYSLDFHRVKTKHLGTQDLPTAIYFETEKDFVSFLGKEREVELFSRNHKRLISTFPELRTWCIQNPSKIIQNQDSWEDILKVCIYFKENPNPNLYVRELPIFVHTKFVENNKGIIKELLDILISECINAHEKHFEKRYNLKYSEPQVRFKILDSEISKEYFSGLDDIAVPLSKFAIMNLPLEKVIIVENKTSLYTTLTLPGMKNTLAIFGSGYSVNNLGGIGWLKSVELLYWGDIDVQGFEILSLFRGFYPGTKSVLMDQLTFQSFFENDSGTESKITMQLNLTSSEQELYEILKSKNWRLEQEKIPFDYVTKLFGNSADIPQ